MWNKDEIEVWARLIRNSFLLITIGVFIAANIGSFKDNQVLMYLFFIFGILTLIASVYIGNREIARIQIRRRTTAITDAALFSHHKQRGGKMVENWLRKNAAWVAILIVLGAAIALYIIPSNPSDQSKPWWSISLVAVGPIVMWVARLVERRGRDNENLIRQLQPIVGDVKSLEFSIRNFAGDLLNNLGVQEELGSFGVQGWGKYIDSLGNHQLSTISALEKYLKEADPFEESDIRNLVVALNQILGRVLDVESRLSSDLCQKINSVPAEAQSKWEYIQQTHLRLGTQLSSLKPVLSEKGHGDLFDTFINQPPQNLRAST